MGIERDRLAISVFSLRIEETTFIALPISRQNLDHLVKVNKMFAAVNPCLTENESQEK